MGTHINGPSKLTDSQNLSDFLSTKSGDNEIPYLLKVLAIKDPLSIQIHPDKKFAEVLHKNDSNNYKDANHKPELSIAISEKFSLLYGFKSLNKGVELIKSLIESDCFDYTSELYKVSNKLLNDQEGKTYKEFFIALADISNQECEVILDKIINKLDTGLVGFINMLLGKFGKDKGILFAIFMNYFEMNSGNAIFIPPNMPHAYISGDCIECMANSDNVIRVGLTPKFVDTCSFKYIVENYFDDMLVNDYIDIGLKVDESVTIYANPEFKDFQLTKVQLTGKEVTYKCDYHSIFFCLEGAFKVSLGEETSEVRKYDSYFIEKDVSLTMSGEGTVYIASMQN
jgi:mannose-6-phosphate isomerase